MGLRSSSPAAHDCSICRCGCRFDSEKRQRKKGSTAALQMSQPEAKTNIGTVHSPSAIFSICFAWEYVEENAILLNVFELRNSFGRCSHGKETNTTGLVLYFPFPTFPCCDFLQQISNFCLSLQVENPPLENCESFFFRFQPHCTPVPSPQHLSDAQLFLGQLPQ